MSETPFMQLYVSDFIGDTLALSTEQVGAYLLSLMAMWNAGGSLPDDDRKLARITRLSLKKWLAIRPDIEVFFTVEDGTWSNERLNKELQKVRSKSESRASAGAKGGASKALKYNNSDVAIARDLSWHLPEPYISSEDKSSSDNARVKKSKVKEARSEGDGFPEWWEAFPNKVGKSAASKKYSQVVRSGKATPEILMAGIKSYISSKPSDRPWCNPLTWLNQGRWEDKPAETTNAAEIALSPDDAAAKTRETWARFGIERAAPADPRKREDWADLLAVWFGYQAWQSDRPNPRHPQCDIPAEMVTKYADKYGWAAPGYRKVETVAA